MKFQCVTTNQAEQPQSQTPSQRQKKNKFPALSLALTLAASSFAAQAHHQLYGLPQSSAGWQSVNNDNKVAKSQPSSVS